MVPELELNKTPIKQNVTGLMPPDIIVTYFGIGLYIQSPCLLPVYSLHVEKEKNKKLCAA